MLKKKKDPKGAKSWTRFQYYDKCKLLYYFMYVAKKAVARGFPLRFGSAFHDFRYKYFMHCSDEGVKSDWDAVPSLAKKSFQDQDLPLESADEFYRLCRTFAENRPYNSAMGFEVRFGINRDGSWSSFEKCDGFRGIADGIEIQGSVGVVTDAKTSYSMDLDFTQIEIYAAILSIRYPEVETWRLVYDFVRRGRIKEKEVLAANLEEVRDYVLRKIKKIESTDRWEASPGEHCGICSFASICDYKMQGLMDPATDAEAMIADFFLHKVKAKQIKKILKEYVEVYGTVEVENAVAAFFGRETSTVPPQHTGDLIKVLKTFQRNPLNYVGFPADSIKKIMKDDELVDDVAPFIFTESKPVFDIRKKKQGD